MIDSKQIMGRSIASEWGTWDMKLLEGGMR